MVNYNDFLGELSSVDVPPRIMSLKGHVLNDPRYMSIEQARIVTETYRNNEGKPRLIKRALAITEALSNVEICIDPDELIVGNRTAQIRSGVVSPEAGVAWLKEEIGSLPVRAQDRFDVRPEDRAEFESSIWPYWRGKGLRDEIEEALGPELKRIETVVKINQKDHSQGHICPDTRKWLRLGPTGLLKEVISLAEKAPQEKQVFYSAVRIVLEGALTFMRGHGQAAKRMAEGLPPSPQKSSLSEIAEICENLTRRPPASYHEALQSTWFLFVILHVESNANSISPGRMDQYLYSYFESDFLAGRLTLVRALELTEALWIKFNHVVYMRNSESAKYFAGFTTGFNVAIGGRSVSGGDATNLLSFIFLKAQEHVRLPQPNLSARIHAGTPKAFLEECIRVISSGCGMPQIFNDESIIPALRAQGIARNDAVDYAIVGCVELTTHGNNLGWSDAAMFNMVKVLEVTLNNGRCLLTGQKIGLETGSLPDYKTFRDLENAYRKQIDYFIEKMMKACRIVDALHAKILPSPFLSSVIDDCLGKGMDVTAGGAHYNYTGIQAIQVANIADCFAALKVAVYKERLVDPSTLLDAMKKDYEGYEELRNRLVNKIPKFGNDVAWVDEIAQKWIKYFQRKVSHYRNVRDGRCQVGLYTVSAHVPMGLNVGATPDGRKARQPLADGGMSAVYGRDRTGPTALLKSVSRIQSKLASNGSLLNMKFLPEFFSSRANIDKFSALLKAFVKFRINHVQFNVVSKDDLLDAQKNPENHRGLLIRVAGYTAYFTELADDLQNEIIQRTEYGDN
ncbi:MAG: formate C-acetyltransferase/glycerol dehydratase family glycyl radical enzyme [Spirochaetia bacterium]